MPEYSIGGLSKQSGVPVKAIRFYTDSGLLPPARTAPSGYRYYTERELARLHQIVGLRWLGASLRQISALLAGHLTLADVLALQRAYLATERDRLQQLEARLSDAEQALKDGEAAVWTHLYQLREMMQKTSGEHQRWVEQWWRQQLAGKVPAEAIDEFVQLARAMVSRHDSSPVAATVRAGIWAGLGGGPQPGTQNLPGTQDLPGTPREAGLGTEETWSEWTKRARKASQDLQAASGRDPVGAYYQAALRQWASCFGPLKRETVERLLAGLDDSLAKASARARAQAREGTQAQTGVRTGVRTQPAPDGAALAELMALREGLQYLAHMLPE